MLKMLGVCLAGGVTLSWNPCQTWVCLFLKQLLLTDKTADGGGEKTHKSGFLESWGRAVSGGGAPSSVEIWDWAGEKLCLAGAPGLGGSSQPLLGFSGAPR